MVSFHYLWPNQELKLFLMYYQCNTFKCTSLITSWLSMKARGVIFQNLFSKSPGKHTKLWFSTENIMWTIKWAKQTSKIYVLNSRTQICGKLTPEPLQRMPTTDCEKIQIESGKFLPHRKNLGEPPVKLLFDGSPRRLSWVQFVPHHDCMRRSSEIHTPCCKKG